MKRLEQITEEEWNSVNQFNKDMLEDFLTNSTELSERTKHVYLSNLKIFFVWVKNNLNNKELTAIKPLEYKKFQNWLVNRGCSSSDVYNKRAAISSLNGYVEVYYQEEYPLFRNFINKSIKRPPKAFVNEKEPLTKEEFNHLVSVLKERGETQKVAYLLFTFSCGCRRNESRQLLKSVADSKPIERVRKVVDKDGVEREEIVRTYQTNTIRCKGGKMRKLYFSQEAMDAIKAWLAERGEDDCPYVFVVRQSGQVHQVGESTFNNWASDDFQKIVGRRFTPHAIRRSRATIAVNEEGKDIESVKALLGHESIETTQIYVIRDDSEDLEDLF